MVAVDPVLVSVVAIAVLLWGLWLACAADGTFSVSNRSAVVGWVLVGLTVLLVLLMTVPSASETAGSHHRPVMTTGVPGPRPMTPGIPRGG